MKRLLLIVATLVGILMMHGGVAASACSGMATGSGSMPMTGGSIAPDHTPAPPQPASKGHLQATCLSPSPPAAVAAPQRQLDHASVAPSAAGDLAVAPRLGWPPEREPPRLRQRDPTDGLGVLRI